MEEEEEAQQEVPPPLPPLSSPVPSPAPATAVTMTTMALGTARLAVVETTPSHSSKSLTLPPSPSAVSLCREESLQKQRELLQGTLTKMRMTVHSPWR